MLLLPLLIWTATLIGCVQPYDKHECGKKYTCLAPKECLGIVEDEEEGRKFKIVAQSEKIKVGCPLLLRFHRYNDEKMRVILETEDTKKTYRSIDVQVVERKAKTEGAGSLFSCVLGQEKAVGRIGDSKTDATPLGGKNKEKPLRCEFDAVPREGDDVWYIKGNDILAAKLTTTDGTEETSYPMDSEVAKLDYHCDPDRLIAPKPNDPENRPTERYAPIQYDLGSLVCPPSYERIEYRKSKYQLIDTIECRMNKGFVINGAPLPGSVQNLDVRCVADADYFCDYDVKAPTKLDERTQKNLTVIKGDPTKKKPIRGRIECPANYPYFVMGSRAPVIDYNLTCRTKLTKQLWHYGDTAITKDGPIVYCTNALTCPKLAPTSFDGSYLDKNNQPTCQKDGTLQLKKGGSTILDPFEGRVGCNEKEGWMGYETKGQWQRITDEVFYCHYINRAELKDKQNEETVAITIVAIVGCFFLICLVVSVFYLWHYDKTTKKKKREAERAAERDDKDDSVRYIPPVKPDFGKMANMEDKPRRAFEAVRSARSLCGKKMPLRLTAEDDPEPTTLKTSNSAWALPPLPLSTAEAPADCPLSARPNEEALFDKVFAKMDEGDREAMSLVARFWMASEWAVGGGNIPEPIRTRAEALFNKMKAEGRAEGEYVPVTTHPSWASEARAAAIATWPRGCGPIKRMRRRKSRGKSRGKRSGQRSGKRSGERSGHRSGKRSGERSGERSGHRSGKRHAE